MLTPELERTLNRALASAKERRHEYATIEHLLYALLEDQEAAHALRACHADFPKLRHQLLNYLDKQLGDIVSKQMHSAAKPTAGFQRILQRAAIQVQSEQGRQLDGAAVLIALFSERESHATFFLREQRITKGHVMNFVYHGYSKPIPAKRTDADGDDD